LKYNAIAKSFAAEEMISSLALRPKTN